MAVFLEVLNGRYAGTRIEIPAGQTVQVGRTARANVAFAEDHHMSGVHFALEWVSEGLALRDLNSRNGTFLNGQRIEHVALAHGDRIAAGNTELLVHLQGELAAEEPRAAAARSSAVAPASTTAADRSQTAEGGVAPLIGSASPMSLLDAPWLPPLTSVTAKLLEALRGEFQPLYAILDSARDPLVLAVLFQCDQEYQSLYEGPEGEELSVVAPYLVRLPKDSPLLEVVARTSWGKSWGVFFTSDSPFAEVRKHLRYFLMVKLPEGKQVYFRFYDPRVLRVYLPTCTADEMRSFFGPIKCFLMEGEKPQTAVRFAPSPRGVQSVVASLSPKDEASSAGAPVVA
jgi:hypothetical protein